MQVTQSPTLARDPNPAPVAPPLVIEHPENADWSDEADVLVVGFGGSGVCAALEARASGADVLAIDRFAGGGATRFSGGVVYAGGGTAIQREAGVEDTPDEMAKYLAMEVGEAVPAEVVRRYCDESSAQLDWLMEHGVPFNSSFYREKIVYPPEGFFLQYSGNEKAPEYAEKARPAARGHRTFGEGFTGNVFFDRLRGTAEKKGVRVLEHSPVTRLVLDGSGRVIGVQIRALDPAARAEHQRLYDKVDPMKPFNAGPALRASRAAAALEAAKGDERLIRARRGVILTAGGYSHNPEMMRESAPLLAANLHATMRMASLGCNGSGHLLGTSAGARIKGLEKLYVGRVMSPPGPYLHGVLVNRRGERFVNEDGYNSIVGGAILDQPDGQAWLILNRRDFWRAIRECLFSGWATFRYFGGAALLNILFGGTKHASSMTKLAKKLGMDAGRLKATIDAYNAAIGGADAFGKLPENRAPLDDAPFWAINFSISNTFAFT